MIIKIANLFISKAYNDITLSWVLPAGDYLGFRVYKVGENGNILLDTLLSVTDEYVYSIPLLERGAILGFGISVVDATEEGEVVEEMVSTIPNPITGIALEDSSDNIAKIKWDEPVNKPQNIKGYQITRFELGGVLPVELGIAAVGRFVDIGNFYQHPTSGKDYEYVVSTINYQGEVSSSESLTVFMQTELPVVKELLRKTLPVSGEAKYRIKTVTPEGGSSQWVTFQKLLIDSSEMPHDKRFRIRAVTVDNAKSLPLITRSITCLNNFSEAYPTFRLRAVDVDGIESDAITVIAQDLLWRTRIILNNFDDVVVNENDNTMVGRL